MLERLSPHTKIRRLGYVKLLVDMYKAQDFFPLRQFDIGFEKAAGSKEIRHFLREYKTALRKDDKGEIIASAKGSSAHPYIRFAESLSIVAKVNYSYVLTKHGKVYRALLDEFEKGSFKFRSIIKARLIRQGRLFEDSLHNPFLLNTLDVAFFMRQLMLKDWLYLKAILATIQLVQPTIVTHSDAKYAPVKKAFTSVMTKILEGWYRTADLTVSEKQAVHAEIRKQKSLRRDLRSYESIVEPRIGWLLDLELVDGARHFDNELRLTPAGMSVLDATRSEIKAIPFVERNFFSVLSTAFNIPAKASFKVGRLIAHLNASFRYFHSIAPDRIAASQAINYVCFMSFLRDGVRIEYDRVKEFVFEQEGRGFAIDWFPSENDGSIKRV